MATAEFEPPQACINRLMKAVLPNNVQITKDARAAFTRAAGIFIFYLTHCANDIAREKKRQTVSEQDVLLALKELDMEEFLGPIGDFMREYHEKAKSGGSSSGASGGKAADDSAAAAGDEEGEAEGDGEEEEEGERERGGGEADEEEGEEDGRSSKQRRLNDSEVSGGDGDGDN